MSGKTKSKSEAGGKEQPKIAEGESSQSRVDGSADVVPEGSMPRPSRKASMLSHVAAGALLKLDTPKAVEQVAKVFGYSLMAAVPNVL